MGWNIRAGKEETRLGYCGYLVALRDIAHVLDPEHEACFANLASISDAEWDAIARKFKPELYLLCCASDIAPTYTPSEAKRIADFLEQITEPTKNVEKLQHIFFHARRYNAKVQFS